MCVLIWMFLNERFVLLNPIDLKSRCDEEKSLKEAADERLAKLTEQLQKEKQENERLQTELVRHALSSHSLLTKLETYFFYRPFMNVVLLSKKE